jgi:hypothetical protein
MQAVLAGLGGEQQAAAQVLDEMLSARLAQQRRSSDGLARRGSDGGALPQGHTPDAALATACPVDSPEDYELAADLAEEPYRCGASNDSAGNCAFVAALLVLLAPAAPQCLWCCN